MLFLLSPFFLCYSALKYDDLSLSQADEAKMDNGTAKGIVCVHLNFTDSASICDGIEVDRPDYFSRYM